MLIFDLDGTILDSNGIWMDIDRTFLARRNAPYTEEYRAGVAHTILKNCAVFVKEYLQLTETCEEIIEEWMELAKDAYRDVALKPHVRDYLERCRDADHRMAIFTACVPEHCETALAHHNLTSFFEQIIYAQELGEDKSSPFIFRHVAALLGEKPSRCVFFDDSLTACKAAKAAGMTVVGIRENYFSNTHSDMKEICDQFIEDFGELL